MNKWNADEHQIIWNRKKDEDGVYTYRIICDGSEVYMQQIDPSGISFFEVEKLHRQFLDLMDNYRKTGILPSRISRYMKK